MCKKCGAVFGNGINLVNGVYEIMLDFYDICNFLSIQWLKLILLTFINFSRRQFINLCRQVVAILLPKENLLYVHSIRLLNKCSRYVAQSGSTLQMILVQLFTIIDMAYFLRLFFSLAITSEIGISVQ